LQSRKAVLFLLFSAMSALALALIAWPFSATERLAIASPPRTPEHVATKFAKLPLRFEENRGQTDPQARFVSRGPGYALFLTSTEAVLTLRKPAVPSSANPRDPRERKEFRQPKGEAVSSPEPDSVIRLRLVGANPSPQVSGVEPLSGRANYLLGNDPAQWSTDVPVYAKVKYEDLYPGVDLVYYGNPQELEYDFIVAPGADPAQIEMDIAGAEQLRVDSAGELVLAASGKEVRFRRPVIYQETERGRREIAGGYALLAPSRVAFEIAAYDAQRPLVIDPVLVYSTYLGGLGSDVIQAIAVDTAGSVYVAGVTDSVDFPTLSPFQATKASLADVFVSKLSADGSALVYSTYLGGNDDDVAQALAVSSSGNVTIGGYTFSTNFPTAAPLQSSNRGSADAFVARLSAGGSALLFSTYLGGSDDDLAWALRVDDAGNTYVAGETESSNFPVANAFQNFRLGTFDGFVTKLNAAGSALVYSTYLGGNAEDGALGIAVDASGSALVTGYTVSANFPTASAVQTTYGGGSCVVGSVLVACFDAFATKFSPAGTQLLYSTYLGGSADDYGAATAVDSSGSAIVAGVTTSPNYPVVNPRQATLGGLGDAFVTKLSPGGSPLVYSTYLGGAVSDAADAIAVDADGNAYVSGITESSNFPLLNTMQGRNGFDAFVTKINAAGSALMYSTFLGGNGRDEGFSIAVDGAGDAYVAGGTNSGDFPRVNPFQNAYRESVCGTSPLIFFCPDGFISKLSFRPGLFVGGMVSAASFAPGTPVSPGSIVALFGADMTTAVGGAAAIPLPTTLAGLSVRMNNILAPLFFASGGQINLQVPWELAGQTQANVTLIVGSTTLNTITVNLAGANPGIFPLPSQGTPRAAIVISTTGEVAAPVGSIPGRAARPATRGVDYLTIYCTGLGAVSNRPASGGAALDNPLSVTLVTPTVTIGGVGVAPVFSGMVPSLVGLYQVNVLVPAEAPAGSAVPLVISMGGTSHTVQIAVQ
jgi:uncharacterized protein (TIGR03437 family)